MLTDLGHEKLNGRNLDGMGVDSPLLLVNSGQFTVNQQLLIIQCRQSWTINSRIMFEKKFSFITKKTSKQFLEFWELKNIADKIWIYAGARGGKILTSLKL